MFGDENVTMNKQLPDNIMAGDEDQNGHFISKEKAIFQNLEYSSAKESDSAAMSWINSQKLGDFVMNKMIQGSGDMLTVTNRSNDKVVAHIPTSGGNVGEAVKSGREAKEAWGKMQGHIRARHLYSVTREVQKQGKLLAVMECISTGVAVRECKNVMLANLVQTLYHFTGWAELSPEVKDCQSRGIVAVLLPEVDTLTQIAQQVVPALAAGNCVIVSPSAPLPALLFASLCVTAGLPPGVLSVVVGDKARQALLSDRNIAMLSGALSTKEECRSLVSSLQYPIPVSLCQVGKSSMIVFSNSDIDSAVDCLADKGFYASGQAYDSVGKVLVQSSCYEKFCKRLKEKISKLRVGDALDHSNDVGATTSKNISAIKEALTLNTHLSQFKSSSAIPDTGSYHAPTVLLDVQPSNDIWDEVLLGPLVKVASFRTAKEAVAIVNHSKQGVGCSVWSEKNSLIMQLTKQLNVGTVWVNCHGIRESSRPSQYRSCTGSMQCGGVDLLKLYMSPAATPRLSFSDDKIDPSLVKNFGKATFPALPSDKPTVDPEESVNRTIKLFIGGALKRSANDSYRTVLSSTGAVLGSLPDANKKDIRDAVEAAAKAFPGWSGKSGFNRSQILYFLAENICRRKEDFAEVIAQSTGRKYDDGMQEVDTSLQRLFMAAAWADKFTSSPWEQKDPVGVIGITAPSQWPMLGLCSLLGPAIAAGNTVVVLPSDKFPLVAADLCQVIATSDIPGGVVNMVYGSQSPLSLALAQHQHVQAVWYFGYPEGCHVITKEGVENNKQVWCEEYDRRKWNSLVQGTGYTINRHCYNNKVVVMPPGDTFAN
ncbi:hypothetical protein ACHWQZ_G012663 [Mnemiopsis leidyi]